MAYATSKPLAQARALQDLTFDAITALKESATRNGKLRMDAQTAGALARLVSAWYSCQERVRINLGKPLTVRPGDAPRRRNRRREWQPTPPAPALELRANGEPIATPPSAHGPPTTAP